MKRLWPRSPVYRWLIFIGSLLYVISPFDLSPDFIPLLGQIDDFVVLTLLLSQMFRLFTAPNAASTRSNAVEESSQEERTTINVTAVPVDEQQ